MFYKGLYGFDKTGTKKKCENNLGQFFLLTHYSPMLLFIPPENIRKPNGFLMFSGGIEKQHRAVMG